MKAWRKHNMDCATKLREVEEEYSWKLSFYSPENPSMKRLALKIKEINSWKLRTKTERRHHFQSEVAVPSKLLLNLFKRVGLPTPQAMP